MPASAPPGIGSRLRRARLDRALSIEETAWRTRIRPDVLRAIEREEFETIGHQAFVRSHLASYARFLGLDPVEIVVEFTQRHEEPEPSSIEQLEQRRRAARKPPRAKWLAAAAVSCAVLIAAGAVGLIGEEQPPPAPLAARLGAYRASRSATRPIVVPASEARVRLRLDAIADTEVSVVADGEQIFEGVLGEGRSRLFRARRSIEVMAGDGGGVALSFNGKRLGVAGTRGAVYRARFGPRGRISG